MIEVFRYSAGGFFRVLRFAMSRWTFGSVQGFLKITSPLCALLHYGSLGLAINKLDPHRLCRSTIFAEQQPCFEARDRNSNGDLQRLGTGGYRFQFCEGFLNRGSQEK
jgi:hypothetical protein